MSRDFLPVCLRINGCKILVVGGGKAARQKLRHLVGLNGRITVIAQKALPAVKGLAKKKKITLWLRGFKDADIHGYQLAYACTDNLAVNRRIAHLAKQNGVLCNIAGDQALSDFISPAVYANKKYLIGISTFGQNPELSVRLRDQIKAYLEK